MEQIETLEKKSKQLRRETLSLARENYGYHFGGSFSIIELLISLYDSVLTDEDKFILSKGHACFPMYVLLREKGYNPNLSGHPDIDCSNGICCSTGSLGHGFPIGIGMALAKKLKNEKGRVYVLIGDGECQEGTTWESLLLASHHNLDNLTLIIDHNKIQGSGKIDDILSLGNLNEKIKSFDWNVLEINGHSYSEIIPALQKSAEGKPTAIIAHTIKGKGVSFMEDKSEWHAKSPDDEQLKQAYEELK